MLPSGYCNIVDSKKESLMGKNIMYIFRPYITKKGKRIYPKRAKVFKIPIKRGRLALKEKKTTTK